MIKIRIVAVILTIISLSGCGGEEKEAKINEGDIIQNLDESIFLSLKDAYLLYDDKNPNINTAEWGFTCNSAGRYEVWLSSHTKDTMNLTYDEPVIVHFGDTRLESQPIGNTIVLNDNNVSKPFFRADSRLGSILIEDTGHYNLQIVSEKVLPNTKSTDLTGVNTILDQIILIPQAY